MRDRYTKERSKEDKDNKKDERSIRKDFNELKKSAKDIPTSSVRARVVQAKRILKRSNQPVVEIPKSKPIEHRNQFFMDEYAIEKKKLFKFKTGRGE